MKLNLDSEFVTYYRKLPLSIRQQARKAYRLFRENPKSFGFGLTNTMITNALSPIGDNPA